MWTIDAVWVFLGNEHIYERFLVGVFFENLKDFCPIAFEVSLG